MVDFPQRTEAARRNIREIVGASGYDASGLDDWPVMIRPVVGQPPATDQSFSGENLDYLISQFIARLRTPGAQVSAPVLQTLVASVTEMVSALAKNQNIPQPQGMQPFQPTAPVPQQAWTPSAGQAGNPSLSGTAFTPQMPQRSGETGFLNQNSFGSVSPSLGSGFGESGFMPTQSVYAPVQPAWGAPAQQSAIYSLPLVESGGVTGWENSGFPAFGQEEASFFGASSGENIYMPEPSFGSVQAVPEQVIPGQEDKLAPIQGIKREFVPQGIPLAFILAGEEDGEIEPEPTLFDFIMGLASPEEQTRADYH